MQACPQNLVWGPASSFGRSGGGAPRAAALSSAAAAPGPGSGLDCDGGRSAEADPLQTAASAPEHEAPRPSGGHAGTDRKRAAPGPGPSLRAGPARTAARGSPQTRPPASSGARTHARTLATPAGKRACPGPAPQGLPAGGFGRHAVAPAPVRLKGSRGGGFLVQRSPNSGRPSTEKETSGLKFKMRNWVYV